MKRRTVSLVPVLPLIVIAFVFAAWVFGSSAKQQKASPSTPQTLRQIGQQRDVENEAPLSENSVEYNDLRLLAKHSNAIVIGRIVKEESAFSGDNHIVTTYLVDINRILSDKTAEEAALLRSLGEEEPPAPLSTPLKVVRDGGVVYIDGHRVASTVKGSEAIRAGQDYILFVNWSRDFKAYRLSGGMSGVVMVEPNSTVKPLGSGKGLMAHRGTPLDRFIQELLTNQ